MADDDDGQGDSIAAVRARQDTLESKLDRIMAMLGRDEGKAHGEASQATNARLTASTDVADEIRRQIEARERRDAEQRRNAEIDEWRKSVDAKIGAEQTPEPPVRGVEKIMGWR